MYFQGLGEFMEMLLGNAANLGKSWGEQQSKGKKEQMKEEKAATFQKATSDLAQNVS